MDPETRHRNPARLLAPIALIGFGVVLLLVVSSGGGGGSSKSGSSTVNAAQEKKDLGTTKTTHRQRSRKTSTTKQPSGDTYTVKQGDTLAGIAQTTGVPVARMQELNPGLDQFSLVAGQRIKLR
jgi:LysM repeat protein